MQEEVNNQIEEDLEFDEGNPFTMPEVTDEEVRRLGNYFLSGEYLIRDLEIIRARKQSRLDGLAHLEAAEKEILKRMDEMQINHKPSQSQ